MSCHAETRDQCSSAWALNNRKYLYSEVSRVSLTDKIVSSRIFAIEAVRI